MPAAQKMSREERNAMRRERNAQRKARISGASAKRKRSPAAQLAELDFRLGKGVGAKKERAKLLAKLAK